METIKRIRLRLRVTYFGSGDLLLQESLILSRAVRSNSKHNWKKNQLRFRKYRRSRLRYTGWSKDDVEDIYYDSISHEFAHKVIILVIRRTMRCHGSENLRGRSKMKECKNWTIFGRGYNGANKACRSFGGFSSREITWSSPSTITTPATRRPLYIIISVLTFRPNRTKFLA
jgi:hypothetical protein